MIALHCLVSISQSLLCFPPCLLTCTNLISWRSENDSDPDEGDSLRICDGGVTDSAGHTIAVGSSSDGPHPMTGGGTLSISSDGCYTFSTANGDFESLGDGETAEVCFTYLVCDVIGASASAEVCIEITGENDPPVAEDDSYRVSAENPSVSSNIIEPNDSDPEADNLTIVGFNKGDGSDEITNPSSTFTVSFSSGGEMTVDPNTGSMTYSAADYVGNLSDGESFAETAVYTVSDGNGGTDTATVTILVVVEAKPSASPSWSPSSSPSVTPTTCLYELSSTGDMIHCGRCEQLYQVSHHFSCFFLHMYELTLTFFCHYNNCL